MRATGHILVSALLTDYGKVCIAIYPSLRIPIGWAKVAAVTAIVRVVYYLDYRTALGVHEIKTQILLVLSNIILYFALS